MFIKDLYDEIYIKVSVFLRRRKMAKWRNETPNRLDLLPANPLDPNYDEPFDVWNKRVTAKLKTLKKSLAS